MSAAERIRGCLNKHVKVELDDGRIVFGRFRCTDARCNVIVNDAYELRVLRDVDGDRRVLFRTNVLLIPAQHIARFSVDDEHDGTCDVTTPPKPIV